MRIRYIRRGEIGFLGFIYINRHELGTTHHGGLMRRAYGDSCRRGFGGDSRESRWLSIRTEEYNQRGRRHTAKGAVPGSVSPARSFSCWPTPMKKWGWCGRRLRVVLLLSIVLFVSLLVLLLIWDIACIPTGAAPTTTPFPSSVSFLSSVPFLSYHPSPLVPSFVLRRTVSLHVPYPNHHRYSNGGDRMKSMEEREEAMKENSAQEREDPATYLLDGSELDLYAWKRRRIIRWSQTGLSFKGPHLHDTRYVFVHARVHIESPLEKYGECSGTLL